MELSSGRPVAAVLLEPKMAELGVVPWIQGSAEAPKHGCSCQHFDDPTGRRGRKGECQVFASGLNSIGILFFDPPSKDPNEKDFLTLSWN